MFLLHLTQLFGIQLETELHLVVFNKALGEQFKQWGGKREREAEFMGARGDHLLS